MHTLYLRCIGVLWSLKCCNGLTNGAAAVSRMQYGLDKAKMLYDFKLKKLLVARCYNNFTTVNGVAFQCSSCTLGTCM